MGIRTLGVNEKHLHSVHLCQISIPLLVPFSIPIPLILEGWICLRSFVVSCFLHLFSLVFCDTLVLHDVLESLLKSTLWNVCHVISMELVKSTQKGGIWMYRTSSMSSNEVCCGISLSNKWSLLSSKCLLSFFREGQTTTIGQEWIPFTKQLVIPWIISLKQGIHLEWFVLVDDILVSSLVDESLNEHDTPHVLFCVPLSSHEKWFGNTETLTSFHSLFVTAFTSWKDSMIVPLCGIVSFPCETHCQEHSFSSLSTSSLHTPLHSSSLNCLVISEQTS